jgi:protein gp37
MADKSSIEWTDATWPVTVGCDRVSPGCDHCYALRDGWRLAHNPNPQIQAVYGGLVSDEGERLDWTGVTRCVPERLDWPLRWTRPRRIFVCSQSDLFHKDIPTEFIGAVFDTMRRADQHTYQVLTKRPSRAALLVPQLLETLGGTWPQHIWMGVSVEHQDYTWRVDKLRHIPAPTRFISAEPLLGPLTLNLNGIAWLIAGAESGHGARPMDEDWVRSLRDQATSFGVAFFYKQNVINGKKVPLPALDGTIWNAFPDERKIEHHPTKKRAPVLGGEGLASDEKPVSTYL